MVGYIINGYLTVQNIISKLVSCAFTFPFFSSFTFIITSHLIPPQHTLFILDNIINIITSPTVPTINPYNVFLFILVVYIFFIINVSLYSI